ncbi:MAG: hypothetical protein AB8G14_00930 [Ilumatobacter sp.]
MKIVRGITIAVLGASTFVACGGSDAGGSGESFCNSVKELDDSGVDPDSDPDAAVAALEDLTDKAPSEIKDEFAEFTAALKSVVDGDLDALAELDPAAIEANITTIGTYIGDNCDGVGADVFDL